MEGRCNQDGDPDQGRRGESHLLQGMERGVGMPLPEPRKPEAKGVKAGQAPAAGRVTSVILAAPRSLPAPNQGGDGVGSKPTAPPRAVSLEPSVPPALASTPPTPPAKEQVRPVPRKRSRVDAAAPQPLEFLRTPFGGRLLVHKGFLYKQEKAVGDKVYWKCRRHAELGCRGRAVSRGLRATVMRDHCHPPDEEGPEAGCEKETLPGPSLPEGLGEPPGPEGAEGQEEEALDGVTLWPLLEEPDPILQQLALEEEERALALSLLRLPLKKRKRRPGQGRSLEFLKTCYGGRFLVYRSFLYKREKVVGDKVYWTCRDHALYGCRSRAITQGQRVTMMRRHCHPPDMEGLEARRQQEKATEETTADEYEFVGHSLTCAVDSLLSGRETGALPAPRPQGRKRAKAQDQETPAQPEAPQGSSDEDPGGPEFLRTPLGGSFLVHESFLYRREKAAGDKVYWTCRDQARMGCRSRAITQGRRVTVMRGHCHPPDALGLETLRQRQKPPSPTRWGVPEGPEFLKTPLGGSFLVHESFLYRREKAAGDKVYWTCRDQARMGCRSRAITQGQRVMVMRRHCHPPDMGGLEALRQREHFPNLSQWEGPEPLQPLEFLRTSLGGKFLVHECFLYRKEKAAGEKVYWMCRDQARLGCRSRAITQGRRVMVMRGHCHPPDLEGLEALRQRERQPGPAQQ
ncbi:FLYWCH-type zinc finger-containing protein 1-like isoform X2 [Dipodomys merriami]|uniref:FLYWCH-type zinc finger-containing protein 1-like isoform X2 n=1 Tax=Dipodomys merriami TaxID=94247 RepID=UPI003855814C